MRPSYSQLQAYVSLAVHAAGRLRLLPTEESSISQTNNQSSAVYPAAHSKIIITAYPEANASCAVLDAGRLRPLPTEKSGMSQTNDQSRKVCELLDMGAFYLADFADKQCCPIEGAAVHGGIHIMQIVMPSMLARCMQFPPLSTTFKVYQLFMTLHDGFYQL